MGKDAYDASRGAGYPDDARSFAPNARKRANRRDVKARVAELQERAARAFLANKNEPYNDMTNASTIPPKANTGADDFILEKY